jgi:O-antigen/teichoic acid export membrane protein
MRISVPMLMVASAAFVTGQIGVVTLGMFRSEGDIGHYSAALKLSSLTVFIMQAINTMAAPKFAELYHVGKMDELFSIARKSSKMAFWITLPILLVLILFGKQILNRLFGEEFIVAYPAMACLVFGQFISTLSGSTGYFMNMTGHQDAFKNIMISSAVINIGLCMLLVPSYGINGAAFAAMTGLIFWNAAVLYYIKSKYGRTIGYLPVVMK